MSMLETFPSITIPVIAFEDETLIAFAKPQGMHSVPGSDGTATGTLVAFALETRSTLASVAGRKHGECGLLHRLDRDTSGLLLFAKTQSVFESMLELMNSGGILKTYTAICASSGASLPGASPEFCPAIVNLSDGFADGEVTIKSLFRNYGEGAKRVAPVVSAEGLRGKNVSGTVYRTLARRIGSEGGYERYAIGIRNGFRHQIRAHLAWCCRPIVGDALYGGKPENRLFLHAERLDFTHPLTGKTLAISYPNS